MTFFLIALTAYFALDEEREHAFLGKDKSARTLPLPLTTPRPPLTKAAVSSQYTQPSSSSANWNEEDPTRSGLGFPAAFRPDPACSRGREGRRAGGGRLAAPLGLRAAGAAGWAPRRALTACRPGGSCRRSAGWIPSRSPAAAGSSPCLQGSAAPSARPEPDSEAVAAAPTAPGSARPPPRPSPPPPAAVTGAEPRGWRPGPYPGAARRCLRRAPSRLSLIHI